MVDLKRIKKANLVEYEYKNTRLIWKRGKNGLWYRGNENREDEEMVEAINLMVSEYGARIIKIE